MREIPVKEKGDKKLVSQHKEKAISKKVFTLFVIISALIALGPMLMADGVLRGFDDLFHIARMGSLTNSMQHGIFPVKVHPVLCNSYGYGVGFFYPNFFLYLPSTIMLLGGSFEVAFKVYVAAITLGGALLTYVALSKVSKCNQVAAIFSIVFIESVAYYYYVYYLFSVGSYTAMIFMPSAICGVILLLRKGDVKAGVCLYSIGIVGALLSHSSSFIELMIIIALLCLFDAKAFFKKETLIPFAFSSLFSMAFTAGYWLPAIEQALSQTYKASSENLFHIYDGIMTLYEAVTLKIGLIIIVLMFVSIVLSAIIIIHKKSTEGVRVAILALCVFLISIFPPFWNTIGRKLDFIQFTFRLNAIITSLVVVAMSILTSECADEFRIADLPFVKKMSDVMKRLLWGMAFAVLILVCNIYSKEIVRNNGADYVTVLEDDINELIHDIMGIGSGAEWLPSETWQGSLDQPNISLTDDFSGAEGIKHDDGKYYDVYVNLDEEFYDVPYVYYYGYRAYLLDENGEISRELSVDKAISNNGLVRVYMPDDLDGIGHIMVSYRKTLCQKVSYLISACSVLALVIGGLIIRFGKNRNGEAFYESCKRQG